MAWKDAYAWRLSGASALFLILILFALPFLQGCGDDSATATGAGSGTVAQTATGGAGNSGTSTAQTSTGQTATVTTPAECPPQPAAGGCERVEIVSIEIDTPVADVGDPVTFTIRVSGDAQQVSVIYGGAGGDVSTPHYISAMLPQGTSAGVTTWQTTVPAPQGFPSGAATGTCFYTGQALSRDDVLTRTTGNLTFTVNS
ncbi:MAG: hypothetical protein AB1760_13945 [Pseudomonadota bacterium]